MREQGYRPDRDFAFAMGSGAGMLCAKTSPAAAGVVGGAAGGSALPEVESLRGFCQRLAGAGLAALACDAQGALVRGEWRADGGAWSGRLGRAGSDGVSESAFHWWDGVLTRSVLVCSHVVRAVRRWQGEDEPTVFEPIDGMGLWFVPIRVSQRSMLHRRHGVAYIVVVIVSERLISAGAGGEMVAALCASAGVGDVQHAWHRLRSLPPAGDGDVARLAGLVRWLWEDSVRLMGESLAVEATGKQLAESYEEINLLYSIIGSMTAPGMQQPERFLRAACQELRATLPYRWIAVMIGEREPLVMLRSEARARGGGGGAGEGSAQEERIAAAIAAVRHFLVVGEHDVREGRLREVVAQLLVESSVDSPTVIEEACVGSARRRPGGIDAALSELGSSVLVQPVKGPGQREELIGVLVAGGKYGDDPSVTNIDIKLLGAVASHMAIFLENAALYGDLNAMFMGTLEALTASIDAKDRYTCGHSRRVASLTQQLARAVGMDEQQVKRMRIAGLVHDVGKIGVPEHVLLKPGKLTKGEFAWIKKHPEMGYRILKDIPQLQDILPGVLHHHERWDGRGYPSGLKAEAIPQVARLIGLADSFDAMSSSRTYRAPMKREAVLSEIERCAGAQFDPELAAAFVKLDFREYDGLVRAHRMSETVRE